MTNCCRKCSKKFCANRNEIENCKDCVSYLWLALQEIDKNLKESWNDPVYTLKKHG